MKVYAVTIYAIYDHGLAGIYTSYDAAFKRAEELWGIGDGHHDFRIEEIEVDQPFDAYVDRLPGSGRSWVLSLDPKSPLFHRQKRLLEPAADHIRSVFRDEKHVD